MIRKFYRDAGKVIHIKYYQETLDADINFIYKLMLPFTLAEVKEMEQKYLTKYFRFYIEQKLQQYLKTMVLLDYINSIEI